MCWRMILFVGVVVTAQQLNPHDWGYYVDSPEEDARLNESAPINVVEANTRKGDKSQDMVEKLLSEPVVNYEKLAAAHAARVPTRSTTNKPTRSIAAPTRTSKTTKRPMKSTTTKLTGLPYWGEEEGAHSPLRAKHTRARQRTTEEVYSVIVGRWDDGYQPWDDKNFRPGVIESLVGAHDIVRFETRPTIRPPLVHVTRHYDPAQAGAWTTPVLADLRTADGGMKDASTAYVMKQSADTDKSRTGHNATWTAFNEGGIRGGGIDTNQGGRRQAGLVTLPAHLLKTWTRRPRPTPTWTLLTFAYRYTRRTRRNRFCTDTYYECLNYCFDDKGYKVNCPWYTPPTRPEPARINFTGLFWAIQKEKRMTDYVVSNIFQSWKDVLVKKGYRSCRTFVSTTPSTPKSYPVYYDDVLSPGTGRIMAKCWVCGLREQGIPRNSNCFDIFSNTGASSAMMERHTYRKYCRWMTEVPMWFNRTDPFSVWGQWTGGCSYRWLDLSGLYAQRACRSTIIPAEGMHYLSRRMARLELALRDETDGCVVSPMASLVPFSRAISLYARFHVCVCRGSWCNRADHRDPPVAQLLIFCVIVRKLCVSME